MFLVIESREGLITPMDHQKFQSSASARKAMALPVKSGVGLGAATFGAPEEGKTA